MIAAMSRGSQALTTLTPPGRGASDLAGPCVANVSDSFCQLIKKNNFHSIQIDILTFLQIETKTKSLMPGQIAYLNVSLGLTMEIENCFGRPSKIIRL